MVVGSETSLLELQISAGVGSSIVVDYIGKITGTSQQELFPFRLTNKLFLPTTPGESYDLTFTLNGRGSNPLSRTISGILFHTYPSPIRENATLRKVTLDSIVVDYSIIGIFSELVWITMPANAGCPCVTTMRSGKYTIGGSSNPLTAGAEYSIYAQTKTAMGFLSDVFTITQSTYVSRMTNPVVDANSTSITLSVTFESGVGSSVDCILHDLQGNEVQTQTALDFRLGFSVQFSDLSPTTCFQIDVHAYSLGSSPLTTSDTFAACTRPPIPTADDASDPMKRLFKFHLGSLSRENEKYVYYEWYQNENEIISFTITNSELNINLNIVLDINGWEISLTSTLTAGAKYTLMVSALSTCCGYSFPKAIDGSTAPYPPQNFQLSTIQYDEDFIEVTWDIYDEINDNVTVYLHPVHLPNEPSVIEMTVYDPSNVFTVTFEDLEFGRKFHLWSVSFSHGKASVNSTLIEASLFPQKATLSSLAVDMTVRELEVLWSGVGFFGKAIHTVNVTGNPSIDCLMNTNDLQAFQCTLSLSAFSAQYSQFYQVSTVFESNGKQTDPIVETFITPPKQPLSPELSSGYASGYYYKKFFYDPDDPEIGFKTEYLLCEEFLPNGLETDSCNVAQAELRSGEESMPETEVGAGRSIKPGSEGRAQRRAKLKASREQDGYGSRRWEQGGKKRMLCYVLEQCGKQKCERNGEQSVESMPETEVGAGRWIEPGSEGRAQQRLKLKAGREQDGYGAEGGSKGDRKGFYG
ncbi:uncharacterized protein LOC142345071 [Convolutriloba macropyga]|uniref:uncharacterized protein LOC142345071 n=1 Tax=Convolutriloba macropyga TaxID=536237 RepID=UPI003F51C735